MSLFYYRYIIAEIKELGEADDKPLKLNSTSIYFHLMKKIQQLHGDFGVAAVKTGLNVKYCNEQTRLVVIRARHGPHRFVASSLPILDAIDTKRVIVNTLYVGATLKQCFKFVLRHQQEKHDEFVNTLKGDKSLLYSMLSDNDDVL